MHHRSPEAVDQTDVELDDGDRARLGALRVKIAPQLPEIAERFCDRVAPGRDAQERQAVRDAVIDWMTTGLTGPYDEAFSKKRARVVPLNVMCFAINVLRNEYDDRIATLYDPNEARLVSKSVDKLLDRELAALVRDHQRNALADRVAAIQTLSTGLAHELRNPVNSARLQLEVLERRLQRDSDGDPKLVDAMTAIDQELERLARLLKEFLAFVRPSEPSLADRNIVELLRGAIKAERPFADSRGVTIELVGAGSLIACVDASTLVQAVQNLVRNAVEAAASGGRVTVRVSEDNDHIRVVVEDDGPGIPDAIRQRIYEPFFTTKPSGTGLGLSIVHSIVASHGGTIDIQSTGRGTRFELKLPRRPA